MPSGAHIVRTTHADIAVYETSGSGLPILLLHGNSFCKEAFDRQLASPLASVYRMIAIDLPGHGASSNAFDPRRSYSMPAYAEMAMEVLQALGVERALGGHVGLELVPRWPGLAGLMITGAPPVAQDAASIQAGFSTDPDLLLAGKADLTEDEKARFAHAACGDVVAPFLREALDRTDPQAREILFANLFAGQASNQRAIAEGMTVPLAIVNGEHEPFANLAYIDSLKLPALWEGKAHVMAGVGHMPFRDAAEAFNALLGRFVDSLSTSVQNGIRAIA